MASNGETWSFDPWAKLGVAFGASINEVKAAWKIKRVIIHPDKHMDNPEEVTKEFQILNVCHDRLSNKATRKCFMGSNCARDWASCWKAAANVMQKIREAENQQQEREEEARQIRKAREEKEQQMREAEVQKRKDAEQRRLDRDEAARNRKLEMERLRQENYDLKKKLHKYKGKLIYTLQRKEALKTELKKLRNQNLKTGKNQLQISARNTAAQEESNQEPPTMGEPANNIQPHYSGARGMTVTKVPPKQPFRKVKKVEVQRRRRPKNSAYMGTHEDANHSDGLTCSCGTKLATKGNLIRHINGFKDVFMCFVCGKLFGRLDNTKRHEKKVHQISH